MQADLYQLVSADVSSVHKTRISLVDGLKRLLLLLVLSTFVPICCPTSLVFVRAPATIGPFEGHASDKGQPQREFRSGYACYRDLKSDVKMCIN